MIAGKALGSGGDVVFSRARDIYIAQDQVPARYSRQMDLPIRSTTAPQQQQQQYVQQAVVNGHMNGVSTIHVMNRSSPSRQRPSSPQRHQHYHPNQQVQQPRPKARSRSRENGHHAAMPHAMGGDAPNGFHQQRVDVEIPHSKAPMLTEKDRKRNQHNRSVSAGRRLQEEAEQKMRDEAERRHRLRTAKEAATKRTSEFTRQQTEREARRMRSTLGRMGHPADGVDLQVNQTSFAAMNGAGPAEMPSRSEFVNPLRPEEHHRGYHTQPTSQLHAPAASMEPELAFVPVRKSVPAVSMRPSLSAWNAEMNSDGVAGIFDAISAAQNAVPRLSYQRLVQDRPDLLDSYKMQMRAEPETTHEIVPDIPLRLRSSRRGAVQVVEEYDDDAMTQATPPPAQAPVQQTSPPLSSSAREQPVINPRAPSPPQHQSLDQEPLAPFHEMLPEETQTRRQPLQYNAQENARKIRRASRMKTREEERKRQERKDKLRHLNATVASRLSKKRSLKRTAEPTVAYRRPVSADPRVDRLAHQPRKAETSRSNPVMDYLAPDVYSSSSEQAEVMPAEFAAGSSSSRPKSAWGRVRAEVNEGKFLKRKGVTVASPQLITSTSSTRRRPRPASSPTQRTGLDDIYNEFVAPRQQSTAAEGRFGGNSQRANKTTSARGEREIVPRAESRTAPLRARQPLYGSSDHSDSGSEQVHEARQLVVDRTSDFRDDLEAFYRSMNQPTVERTDTRQHAVSDTEDVSDVVADEVVEQSGMYDDWTLVARRSVSPPSPVQQPAARASPVRASPVRASLVRASPARATLQQRHEHDVMPRASVSPPAPRTDIRTDTEWVLAKHGIAIEDDMEFPSQSPNRRIVVQDSARIRLPDAELLASRQRPQGVSYHRSQHRQLDDHDPFSVVDRYAERSRPPVRTSVDPEVDDEFDAPLRGSLEAPSSHSSRRSEQRSHVITQTDRLASPDRRDISVEARFEDVYEEDTFQPRTYWDSFLRLPIRSGDEPENLPAVETSRPQRLSPADLHWQMTNALTDHDALLDVELDLARLQSDYVHSTQERELASLRDDVERTASRHKQLEDDLFADQQRRLAWHDQVVAAAILEANHEAQARVQEYQQFANDEIMAGFIEVGVERARLQATRDAFESQRAAETLARPAVVTSVAGTQTADVAHTRHVPTPPAASYDATDAYSDDFDFSGVPTVSNRHEIEESLGLADAGNKSQAVELVDDFDEGSWNDSDLDEFEPVDDLAELRVRMDRCRERTRALENQLEAHRRVGFRKLEELDREALSGSIAELQELAMERAEYLEDYKRKTNVLENRLYRCSLKEYQLMRAFLRLKAPSEEQQADDESISVLSSLLEAPAAAENTISSRYSRSAAVHDEHHSYDEPDGVDEVESEGDGRGETSSIQESIQEDGYSSGFDEDSEAFVRHSHRSRLHNVSYAEDERVSVDDAASVHSAELAEREQEMHSKWQGVWQHVVRHMKSQQKAEKLQQLDREQATLDLATRFLAWLEQSRMANDGHEGGYAEHVGDELPDQLSTSQAAELADMFRESYGDTFEPEVASVQTDDAQHRPPLRESAESIPEMEYSSFVATTSGPGILESPHPSSEEVSNVNESMEIKHLREEELLRTLAQQNEELERLRQLLEDRERQFQAQQARAEEQQQLLRAEAASSVVDNVEDEVEEMLSSQDKSGVSSQPLDDEPFDDIDLVGRHDPQSENYDDSFASSSGLYPDMVAAAAGLRPASAADETDHVDDTEHGAYEGDSFASSESAHDHSVADVASVPEELHSEADEDELQGDELSGLEHAQQEDPLNASMSVEALEASISYADMLLPVNRHLERQVDLNDAKQQPDIASSDDEQAENALVESAKEAIAESTVAPLHLRMTDSRHSMSDDDYGEAYSVDSDTLQANSDFGSPVLSRHQMRSPTRDLTVVVPSTTELDTIEEEDSAPVQTPVDNFEASISVENLDGSMSYADFAVPVASSGADDLIDAITNRLLAEMLHDVAHDTVQPQDSSEDAAQLEPESAPQPSLKFEPVLTDPDSTAELRLSDPTDFEDSTDDLYASVAAHTPQVIRAPRASATHEAFGEDMENGDDADVAETEPIGFALSSQPSIMDAPDIQEQILEHSRKWHTQDEEFCQGMVSALDSWDALYVALQNPGEAPHMHEELFLEIQGSLWDCAPESQRNFGPKPVYNRNFAHFERVNQILQDLHEKRHAENKDSQDLPTRMRVEAISSGDSLRDYVAEALQHDRREYKRSLERKTAPKDRIKLPAVSVKEVQDRAGGAETELLDALVDALMRSLLQDTTHAVLEALA